MRKSKQAEPASRQQRPKPEDVAVAEPPRITKPADLVARLIDKLDRRKPRIALNYDGRAAIDVFLNSVLAGKAPQQMPCFILDGLDMVIWDAMNNPEVPRHGLSLIRLVRHAAIGMAGLAPLGLDGVDEPEPISFARLIEMIFEVEPKFRRWLIVRDEDGAKSVLTTTAKGGAWLGGSVSVEVERLGVLPPDKVFDLAVPYNACEQDKD